VANAKKPLTGGCLCGGVRYEVKGEMRDVVNCHCKQCRKTHGHFGAYTNAKWADVKLTNQASLAWYRSSPAARRGFCRECGGSLFWERTGADGVSIAAGTLDAPTGLRTVRHIFMADAGDYYTVDDGLEKLPGTMG
jgi:hypothetical protein